MKSKIISPRRRTLLPAKVEEAIGSLEKSACRDIQVAKLVLGLYAFVSRTETVDLFPGYQWADGDIRHFPSPLRPQAATVAKWSRGERVVLNELLMSRARIVSAVNSLLKESPYGQARRKIAGRLRRKFPRRNVPQQGGESTLAVVGILPELIGQPISDGTIRLAHSFPGARLQIVAHGDPWGPLAVDTLTIGLRPDGFTIESISLTVEVPVPRRKPRRIEGRLDQYYATGTEGLQWVIEDFDGVGFEKLHWIEQGDHLTIQNRLGHELWSGVIKCDRKAGWRPYSRNSRCGQPCALGYRIHWTQRGFRPGTWAGFFVRPEHDRLHGVLVRKN